MTVDIWIILLGWALAGGSPGPATLAISGTSMSLGRGAGLAIASGVIAGSASWGVAAGLGMSALMLANANAPGEALALLADGRGTWP